MTIRLTWPGRDDAPIDPRGPALVDVGPRPAVDAAGTDGAPRVRLIHGDNLDAMRGLLREGLEGSFALAYLDPPYLSGSDYALEEGDEKTHAYGDRWADRGSYLDMLWPRLRAAHALLGDHGTIWVQVDHRAGFLVQAMLDEIFGHARLRNVIAWRRAPPLGRQAKSAQFPRNADSLIAYAKGDRARFCRQETLLPIERTAARLDATTGRWFTLAPRGDYSDKSVAKLEAEGRIHRTASGKIYVKYFVEERAGVLMKSRVVDSVWDDVPAIRHAPIAERTRYPTQKPERLLERVIASTSEPGDTVLDPFAGSGTTAIVAARLGRSCVAIDASPVAIGVAMKRLSKVEVSLWPQRLATSDS